ncbi:MAG TPA: cation-translocating P-type ATPase C-terminal domain-containing protein [Acidimicrobiales bacterium]
MDASPDVRALLPPAKGGLLNRTVAWRAFGVLGPTVTVMSMAAFLATFVAAGWRPGDPFPGGDVAAAASGAAFMTVVIAQSANAFACRGSSRWAGALGWTTNHLLPPAAAIELVFALSVIAVPALATQLDHRLPTPVGWSVALASGVVVLVADAADKRRRGRSRLRSARRDAAPPRP